MTKDMTNGKPIKLILGFAVPLLLGNLFQQFYNLVDTVIVGKVLGVNSLAAVGSTGSINFLIIGFCMGICNGFAIPVAQSFGAKNDKTLRKYVANSTWLALLFAVIMTIATIILCKPILRLMRTPDDIFTGAYTYIVIIFAGIPATILYNMVSGILRAMGDSKTPLYFLILSAFLNIFLDLFCIIVLHMGVAGAAVATVVSQAVSGVSCLLYMRKKFDILHIRKDEWKLESQYVKNLCSMGIPMGLQYSITAIGSVILQTAVNSLGSMAVAAVTAGSKISMFFCCPFDALGSTMATFGGQNVGARKLDRIDQGLKAGAVMGCVYAVIAFAVLCIFGQWIALMFVDKGEGEILRNTRLFLIGNSLFYIPLVFVNAVRFMIQGLGYSRLAIIAGVCEMAARSFVGFCLVPVFGYIAVCIASPVAWIAADLFLIPAYRHVMKNLNHLFYGRSRATATDTAE